MQSVKCPGCGFVGWADAEVCKKCGATILPHSASNPGQSHNFVNNLPDGRRPNGQLNKSLAICSLVIGIINLFTFGFLLLGAILGITLAVVALGRISKNPSVYGGKEFATAGLVTSILSIVLIVPIGIVAAIVIPNLVGARVAANEESAIQALLQVSSAEGIYLAGHGTYGTLEELAAEKLIKPGIAAGARNGYLIKIAVSISPSDSEAKFQLVAVPVSYPYSGRRSFYVDEEGSIHGADAKGKDATALDETLEVEEYLPRSVYDPDA